MAAFAQISGRLGSEPELRFTHGGTPVINLFVANNRSVKVGEERQSVADWFKVTVFGRDAEVIAQYAKKGSTLAFNGRLHSEKYVDREGHPCTATVLVASSFEFVPWEKRGKGQPHEEDVNGALASNAKTSDSAVWEDDEIPF